MGSSDHPPILLVHDIILICKVQELLINGNHTVGESKELYSTLTRASSVLMYLDMSNTSLSAIAAKQLFGVLKYTDKAAWHPEE